MNQSDQRFHSSTLISRNLPSHPHSLLPLKCVRCSPSCKGSSEFSITTNPLTPNLFHDLSLLQEQNSMHMLPVSLTSDAHGALFQNIKDHLVASHWGGIHWRSVNEICFLLGSKEELNLSLLCDTRLRFVVCLLLFDPSVDFGWCESRGEMSCELFAIWRQANWQQLSCKDFESTEFRVILLWPSFSPSIREWTPWKSWKAVKMTNEIGS